MTFYILGLADKRPILYPLLYLLSLSGNTLFVSDDGAYRRLLPKHERSGYIGNVHVFTAAEVNGELLRNEGINPRDYDHVVFALLDDTDGKGGMTIYAKQDGSPLRQAHPLDSAAQEKGYKTVHIGFKPPTRKGDFFVPITESLMRECHAVEDHCRLSPSKNPKVIAVLSALLAPSFGVTERQMKKLLCYRGG